MNFLTHSAEALSNYHGNTHSDLNECFIKLLCVNPEIFENNGLPPMPDVLQLCVLYR